MAMRYCKDCELYECCMRTPLGGCQDLDSVAPRVDTPVTPEDAWKHLHEQFDWDWEKFRREAAKDTLSAVVGNSRALRINDRELSTIRDHVELAIALADDLVNQLKENKNE